MFDLTNYRNIHFNDVDKLKLSTHTHTGTTVIAHTQTVTSSSEYISYNFWQDGGNYASNWANHSLCKTTFSKVDNTKMMPDTHLALGVCECVCNAVYSGVKWNWEQKIIKYQVQTFLHKIKKKKFKSSEEYSSSPFISQHSSAIQYQNVVGCWFVCFCFFFFCTKSKPQVAAPSRTPSF